MGRRGNSERGRRLFEVIPRDEWEQIVEAAGIDRSQPLLAVRDEAILAVLFGSGLRSFELTALLVEDVADWRRDVGWVFSGVANVRHGKGDKQRLAPIADFALDMLEAYLDVRELSEKRHGTQPLFLSRKGGPLSTRQIRRLVKAAGGRAGLGAKLHPHAARHANATAQVRKAAREGKSLYEVAENLGHASLDTLKIYTHLDVESRRETVRDL